MAFYQDRTKSGLLSNSWVDLSAATKKKQQKTLLRFRVEDMYVDLFVLWTSTDGLIHYI